ncbi:MAG: hypothetical protein P8N07_04095 [Flavobacteriales bacterium]|jgi:hypothetical protein|nr:hypothetical protein [Flavobacteriales bacterium]MDG1174961.1 hypothetical protein [Flavobacteriales bacterium]|tara:strand:- start:37 stop:540 length:504 start_codon:yes stop_codon:yes gene_type:complete
MKNITTYSLLILFALGLSNCKKETLEDKVFQVNKVKLYPSASSKIKEKTESQWVAVLYTNLFQQALSAGDIYRAGQCITSIGDKELAREVIISNFMNSTSPIPQIPTNGDMRADINKFIKDTYERFLIRRPTEGEKQYFRNEITNDPLRTAEIVYFSFALSNEYLFY